MKKINKKKCNSIAHELCATHLKNIINEIDFSNYSNVESICIIKYMNQITENLLNKSGKLLIPNKEKLH